MISQTKHAIDKLKQAGLKRDQFKVHTPRDANKEYGNAQIRLDYKITGLEWAKKIAATGLYVIVLRLESIDSLIVKDDYKNRGFVQVQDHRGVKDLLDVKVNWINCLGGEGYHSV